MLDVREIARGKWHGILKHFGLHDRYLQNKHTDCPVCGGVDRYRFDDKNGNGTYYCSGCGAGDGVNLVMKFTGMEFKEAAKQIEQAAGFVRAQAIEDKESDEVKRNRLRKLYGGSFPLSVGDPVMVYLGNRGITPDFFPAALRYHPELTYYREGEDKAVQEGAFDAMLAVITTPDGKGASLHRTWIKDGQKAPVSNPKKIAKGFPMNGGAIRLTPVAEEMGVAEGIETALAAMQIFNVPTWACVSANGLENWKKPEECKKVIVFADNDANYTGQSAAYSLARKLSLEGIEVEIRIPQTTGSDWADELARIR